MHIVDIIWASFALLGAIYPLNRLWQFRARRSSRNFLWIVAIFATYPLAIALFHVTPFDLGLVYAITLYLAPLYFFSMSRYLGIALPRPKLWRYAIYGGTTALAMLALTNPWHGFYAEFQAHVPGEPNHMLDDEVPRFGMVSTHVLTFVLVALTVTAAVIQFSRSRFHVLQVLVGLVLPILALLSFTSTTRWTQLEDLGISGFILVTTLGLYVLTYALARNHFLEVRLVTRTTLIGLIPDAMVILNRRGDVVDCNEAFETLCGVKARTIVGRNVDEFVPVQQLLAGDQEGQQHLTLAATDFDKHYDVRIRDVDQTDGGETMVLLRDITEQTQALRDLTNNQQQLRVANEQLTRLSVTDPLTGLKNRRYFVERLDAELERCHRGAITVGALSIDLDHFKRINDSHGHDAGDRALVHTSRVMENECRSVDTLARMGGEEFMVLLLDVEIDSLHDTAERFRNAIATSPVTLPDGTEVTITVSIGATLVQPDDSARTFLERLDGALYQAKIDGRDRSVLG